MVEPIRDQEQAIADALLAEQDAPHPTCHTQPHSEPEPVEFPQVIVNNRPLREITAEIVQVLRRPIALPSSLSRPDVWSVCGRMNGDRPGWSP